MHLPVLVRRERGLVVINGLWSVPKPAVEPKRNELVREPHGLPE